MVKSSFGKLEDIRTEAQLLVISLTRLKDSCEDAEIPTEALENLNTAIKDTELFRREVAKLLLVERGMLSDEGRTEDG